MKELHIKRRRFGYYFILLSLLILQCEKTEKQIVIETGYVDSYNQTSVTCIGRLADIGEGVVQYGHMASKTASFEDPVRSSLTHVVPGYFKSIITGLEPSTDYHIRAYASDGNKDHFDTTVIIITTLSAALPELSSGVSSYTSTSVQIRINITNNGGIVVTERGVCWNTTGNPTLADNRNNDGNGTGVFSSNIDGLSPGTTYYIKAYASNSLGTAYGSEMVFTTYDGEFTDSRDGNVYNWVKIGDQVWMAENLAYLPTVSPYLSFSDTSPFYRVNGYEGTSISDAKALPNYSTYGVLYNWPAAMDGAESIDDNPSGVQGVCPSGWHLPSRAEWVELENYLSGSFENDGGAMKESGTMHWLDPNTDATNKSNFTALPGGDCQGSCTPPGYYGYWWSSTESDYIEDFAWRSQLGYDFNIFHVGEYLKQNAQSIRCVKD